MRGIVARGVWSLNGGGCGEPEGPPALSSEGTQEPARDILPCVCVVRGPGGRESFATEAVAPERGRCAWTHLVHNLPGASHARVTGGYSSEKKSRSDAPLPPYH